jgi:large subunit ribosomal protein L23
MDILIRPIITEKATAQSEDLNQYGFMVNKKADKLQIKNAVEKAYGVSVVSVNTMIYAGKMKARSTKAGIVKGREASFKKAMITVAEGQAIDFYGNL